MNFRSEMKLDFNWRVIDLIGHIVLALTLPGKWWFQFLPDIVVPFIMVHGLVTNRLLKENNFILMYHRWLHSVLLAFGFLLGSYLFGYLQSGRTIGLFIGCHWLGHVIWDGFTHKREWHKKGIW